MTGGMTGFARQTISQDYGAVMVFPL